MNLLGAALVLVPLVGTWAQGSPGVSHPPCDSPEAEAAALVAQDYLNSQHTHGYKYTLNRIEDIKIITKPGGATTYLLELDLLETNCHVLDPTPVVNCTVRPKHLTSVEADCDVALTNSTRVLSVIAFKCETEESKEDMYLDGPTLLPLNNSTGLDLVSASLVTFNNKTGNDSLFVLKEVGRMTSQLVSATLIYEAEFVIVETNCTVEEDDNCEPQTQYGFCQVKGVGLEHAINCNIFKTVNGTNDTVPAPLPVIHNHTGNLSVKHGLRHHQLTLLHDPSASGLLSAESSEEMPVIINVKNAPVVTEESVMVDDPAVDVANTPDVEPKVLLLVPVCPGKVKHF